MPVDADGNVADFIMDSDSTVKRMNIGRLYEQYINACSTTLTRRVREMVDNGQTEMAKKRLMAYYQILSPKMHEAFQTHEVSSLDDHVHEVYRNGIYLYLPTDNPVSYMDVVRQLRKEFPPVHGPVRYKGRSGKESITEHPVLIGSMYIMLLEKIASSWSGVSSTKLQHFGIPAKLTNADKHSSPGRQSPVRFLGETEVRLLSAFAGPDLVADLLDQSNNPAAHKEIVNNLFKAERVSDIERIIDRKKFPLGNSRALVFLKHMLRCSGIELKTPYVDID